MSEMAMNWKVMVVAFALGWPAAAAAGPQMAGSAGSVNVTATIEPFIYVSVSTVLSDTDDMPESFTRTVLGDDLAEGTECIPPEFKVLRPGIIDPDRYVVIFVWSNCVEWNVMCSTQGLQDFEGDPETCLIPPERLYLRSHYSDPGFDEGAGLGYESMIQPRMVATGSSVNNQRYEVRYRLEIDNSVKPGFYQGVLQFTVMPTL